MEEAGRNLYKTLRKIKNLGYKKINVVKIPNSKIGVAINDRLKGCLLIKCLYKLKILLKNLKVLWL